MNQNGYHPNGMQGYGQPQNGYAPYGMPPTGQPNASVPNAPLNNGQMNNPYAAPGGYSMPGGYTMPPQQDNGGSFIPQTPYSPGYTSPGYQPPTGGYMPPQQGYPQAQSGYPQAQPGYPQAPMTGYQAPQGAYPGGYNPYSQMGRAPQAPGQGGYNPNNPNNPGNTIPLNGGGYVPPKVPVNRRKFEFREWHLLALCGILIALFVLAVIVTRNPVLKIVLILLAAGSAGFLWVRPLVAENRRLTYTIVALALCALTAVSFLLGAPKDATKNDPGTQQTQTTAEPQNGGVPEIPPANNTADVTPTPAISDTTMLDRLVEFFTLWSQNRQDEMLAFCAPSWIEKQENPRTALFNTLANRFPTNCTLESVSGTDADSSRQVTLTTEIDRKNNKPLVKYRMTVLMVKENAEWFVDPKSLQTNDIEETPDPNITPTPAPTPTAYVTSDTILYYNPKGGKYYHFVDNCTNVGAKYLPLQGTFYYSQINDEQFKDLQPCNVCGAPLRP